MKRKIKSTILADYPCANIAEIRSNSNHAFVRMGNIMLDKLPNVAATIFKKFGNLSCITFIDNETMQDLYYTRRMLVYEGYL